MLVVGGTADKIDKVAKTIVSSGGSATPVVTDATREDDVARLFDRAMAPGAGFDPADLVASNAGNNQRLDFREVTAAQSKTSGASAVSAGFLVGREAARRFVPLGRGTIFTGASASVRGKPGFGLQPHAKEVSRTA